MSQTLENSAAVKPGRIQFIDVLRAFAILMMLQGHFVDTTLDPYYRQDDSWVYNLWHFMRGLTAPVFFTTTGLVFVYLLMRDGRVFWHNYRVKKGIRRGFFLGWSWGSRGVAFGVMRDEAKTLMPSAYGQYGQSSTYYVKKNNSMGISV